MCNIFLLFLLFVFILFVLISMDLCNASCSFIKMVLTLMKEQTAEGSKGLSLLIIHSTGRAET